MLLTTCLMLTVLLGTQPPVTPEELLKQQGKPVPVLVSWHGEIKLELRKDAPENSYILDLAGWDKLWNSWRPFEQKPTLNFGEVLVIVVVGRDPNKISLRPQLSAQGDLTINSVSTMMAYTDPQTCAYQVAIILKADVKSVQGKKLRGK